MKRWAECLLMIWAVLPVLADDWPVWRGPNGNGVSAESGWNASSATVTWSKELGDGYSAVSVKDGRLYTAGHADGQDTVFCLNASRGDEIWRYSYPSTTGQFKGPRATPVIDGENLYMVSRDGEVFCLNASDGTFKWKTAVLTESGNDNSQWGIASSAVISGDLLLLNIGDQGTALDKSSGKVVWKSKGKQSYATPVVFERKGTSCALFFTADGLQVVDTRTGKLIDDYAWKTSYDINGADPLVIGDRIFISSGYGHGCALLDFSTGKLEKVWENELIRSQFSGCVYLDGYIYGVDGQTKGKGFLRCLSVKDGSEKWSMPIGFGSLIAASGKLIALGERGTLYIANAVPDQYDEIATIETGLSQLCWTSPVLANGIIYCRNDKGKLVAIDVSK